MSRTAVRPGSAVGIRNGRSAMGKQEANIYEIAREAGVSIATVSRVMNHSASVSEKSYQKVMAAVSKFNYVPNGTARSLSTSTSNAIGVVIPDINNPFFPMLLQGITRVADEQGYNIFLFNTDEDSNREHQVLHSMREHRLRGIIITPVSEEDGITLQSLRKFESLGIPVVLLDREVDSRFFDRVVTDDERGVYEAVSELIRLGHRRIAIVTGPKASRPGRERLRGYVRAMQTHGIELRPGYIREGDFKVSRAYEQTVALCRMSEPPTAIFASNNMTTYGCLKAFNELGLRAGREISLIGFDDIDALGWLNYNVSVVNRAVPEMGERAMRLLLQRFEKERQTQVGTRDCLPTELILRGSESVK